MPAVHSVEQQKWARASTLAVPSLPAAVQHTSGSHSHRSSRSPTPPLAMEPAGLAPQAMPVGPSLGPVHTTPSLQALPAAAPAADDVATSGGEDVATHHTDLATSRSGALATAQENGALLLSLPSSLGLGATQEAAAQPRAGLVGPFPGVPVRPIGSTWDAAASRSAALVSSAQQQVLRCVEVALAEVSGELTGIESQHAASNADSQCVRAATAEQATSHGSSHARAAESSWGHGQDTGADRQTRRGSSDCNVSGCGHADQELGAGATAGGSDVVGDVAGEGMRSPWEVSDGIGPEAPRECYSARGAGAALPGRSVPSLRVERHIP